MNGLTSNEAAERFKKYGPNVLPEEAYHPIGVFVRKFWAPIPWVLECIILLDIGLDKFLEAGIIFLLLLFNVALSFFQERRAKKALDLLRSRLDVRARVLRDGRWMSLSAQELVPDDLILIRMGDIIPADGDIVSGNLLIDQSILTGESLPIDGKEGGRAYAGSIVKHGEAFVKVLFTGKNSYFGKTAEIIRVAKSPSHLESIVFLIVKYLVVFDVVLVFFVFIYSYYHFLPLTELIPFSLLLLVASVPVALPATFTLATSLGALELCQKGVLVTRLSSIEDAAAMKILCLDKTGTITKNILEVSGFFLYAPYTKADLFSFAALASEEATQDPIDLAILKVSQDQSSAPAKILEFIPFDPERKCSEALILYKEQRVRVFKGAPKSFLERTQDVEKLSVDGSRVIAIALEIDGNKKPVGLIALKDPPREDSSAMIQEIFKLGIRMIMITGDDVTTARTIANMVGLGTRVLSREELYQASTKDLLDADVIAGVLPADKVEIVSLLQKSGYVCGMTGDGVNDSAALRKAEVGIAVANATDVAKASASIVLTRAGLGDIAEAVKTSRRIYQRMLTYTINKITKTLEISVLLGIGLVITNNFIVSQLLIVLLLFTNDFVSMSIATDHVSFSQKPDQWNIKNLMFLGGTLAAFVLGLSFAVLFIGEKILLFSIDQIRTLIFLTLVFTGQATVYLVRERKAFWHSRPSIWMVTSSFFDIAIVSAMAALGIFMHPLPGIAIVALLSIVIAYFFALDFVKRKLMSVF